MKAKRRKRDEHGVRHVTPAGQSISRDLFPAEEAGRFDAAKYLKSDKECALFLESAFEGGDTAHISRAFGIVVRAYGMMKLAKETGLTREALYRMLSEEGSPTLDTVLKVSKAFGLRLTVRAA